MNLMNMYRSCDPKCGTRRRPLGEVWRWKAGRIFQHCRSAWISFGLSALNGTWAFESYNGKSPNSLSRYWVARVLCWKKLSVWKIGILLELLAWSPNRVEKMEVLDVFQGGFHALSTVWISVLFWFRTFHSMLMKLSLGTFNKLFCLTNLQSWSFRQDSHPTLGWYCSAGRAVCLTRRAGRMSRRDEASRRSKEIVRSMYFSCNHKGIAGSSRTSYSTLATNCGFNGWDGSLSPCSQRGSAQLEVGNYLACGRTRGSFEMLGRDNGNANRGSWWCCDNARWTSRRATEWWDVTDENGPS